MATPAMIPVFTLLQAITFNAPLMRVKVVAGAPVPWAIANTVTDRASAPGAAWTALAEIEDGLVLTQSEETAP